MDLSAPLLRRARGDHTPPITVVRGDMRALPFSAASFELVVNLFTSFGYFDSDDQHLAVLKDVARILNSNGWFVLDYFNAVRIRDTLVARDELMLGERRVKVTRRISSDGKYVVKDMDLIDEGRSFHERVRLFEPDEIDRILAQAGFAVRVKYGNYEGDALDATSERALFFTVCR
jgi:SAM-dependent methyltransferase